MQIRKDHVKYIINITFTLAKTQVKKYKNRVNDIKGKKQIYLQFLL
jgi:hypothetical protein